MYLCFCIIQVEKSKKEIAKLIGRSKRTILKFLKSPEELETQKEKAKYLQCFFRPLKN